MARAAESTHWYDREGNPRYTIIGKNGKERNTTLRDAKEHLYVRSVTNILGHVSKPQLAKWLQEQVLDAALELTREPEESLKDFKNRIYAKADEYSQKRREEGTAIHAQIEEGFLNGGDNKYYLAVKAVLDELYPTQP